MKNDGHALPCRSTVSQVADSLAMLNSNETKIKEVAWE
jgi:hypothetical protein